jgi:uncharacterized protein
MTPNPRIWSSEPSQAREQDCACSDEGFLPSVYRRFDDEFAESDCACATTEQVASVNSGPTHRSWQVVRGLHTSAIAADRVLVFNPLGMGGSVVLNQPAMAILDGYREPRPLSTAPLDRQFARLRLLEPLGAQAFPALGHPGVLTAWLHVTNACNLSCRYCYLDQTPEFMNEATGRAALKAIVDAAIRHNFSGLKLKYAGGEPTLNFGVVRSLHRSAQLLAASTGLTLEAVLLTNGVKLTGDTLTFLRDNQLRLMISLDGLSTAHDAQRPAADGLSSVCRVREGIEKALQADLTPHLSITITSLNVREVGDVVDFALDHDLPFNLNFYRSTERGTGLQPSADALIDAVRSAFSRIAARPPARSLLGTLVDRLDLARPHQYACGAGRSYLVVDPQGEVARCHMTIGQSVTDISSRDILAKVYAEDDAFQNPAVDERPSCRRCTWRYWCGGGCPLLAYRSTGNWESPSPYCSVYRTLIPELLRLEGLCLMQTAGATN